MAYSVDKAGASVGDTITVDGASAYDGTVFIYLNGTRVETRPYMAVIHHGDHLELQGTPETPFWIDVVEAARDTELVLTEKNGDTEVRFGTVSITGNTEYPVQATVELLYGEQSLEVLDLKYFDETVSSASAVLREAHRRIDAGSMHTEFAVEAFKAYDILRAGEESPDLDVRVTDSN